MCGAWCAVLKKETKKMKKLIIGLIAAVVAVGAQAAAFQWNTTGTIYGPTGTSVASTGGFTAYLFDTGTVTQSALVTALRDGGSITDYTALSSYTTDSAAKVATTAFTAAYASGTSVSAYFAIVQDDYVYISGAKSATAQDVGTGSFAFGSQSTPSASVFDSTTAYSSAGWYGTAAVPEPTSGLLMLLGMAGLALRRRRA